MSASRILLHVKHKRVITMTNNYHSLFRRWWSPDERCCDNRSMKHRPTTFVGVSLSSNQPQTGPTNVNLPKGLLTVSDPFIDRPHYRFMLIRASDHIFIRVSLMLLTSDIRRLRKYTFYTNFDRHNILEHYVSSQNTRYKMILLSS